MRAVAWIAVGATLVAGALVLAVVFLSTPPLGEGEFLVEDLEGETMVVAVDPSREEALAALEEMASTGESRWVGGEVETFENAFGFRFKPDTVEVAEVTAEGLQAGSYRAIRDDLAYWQGLGVVYVWGKVVAGPP